MTAPVRSGHERLRHLDRRGRAVAAVLAVLAHVLVFAYVPAFAVPGRSRMTLAVGDWSGPVAQAVRYPGHFALVHADSAPVLANGPHVLHRMPKLYPPELWRHREPSSARLQVTIDRSGRVTHAELVDGQDGAGELSLVPIAGLMRFRMEGIAMGPRGIIATVQVGVLVP